MTHRRSAVALALLAVGLTAHAGLEKANETERPRLKADLDAIPLRLGDWVGRDEAMDPDILERTQTTDYINRVYEDTRHPGLALKLWINYSETGLNLRHSPEICLPSGGWTKVEARTRRMDLDRPGGAARPIMKLAYSQGDMVQDVGFWYYIFGEGRVERYVRSLPITSRSSHGRTTRGSGLTVEVFGRGDSDPDGEALREFASALLDHLEPILPDHQAAYYIP